MSDTLPLACLDTGLRQCDGEWSDMSAPKTNVIPARAGIQTHFRMKQRSPLWGTLRNSQRGSFRSISLESLPTPAPASQGGGEHARSWRAHA